MASRHLHWRPLSAAAPRRRSPRGWLAAIVVLGCSRVFGGCSSGSSGEVCRAGDPSPDCVDEASGVTLVTTCGPADASGVRTCEVVSEAQALTALCGAAGASPSCALGGNARRVAGTVAGSTSILLDQGGGTLTLSLSDIVSSVGLTSGLEIEVHAAAVGGGPA